MWRAFSMISSWAGEAGSSSCERPYQGDARSARLLVGCSAVEEKPTNDATTLSQRVDALGEKTTASPIVKWRLYSMAEGDMSPAPNAGALMAECVLADGDDHGSKPRDAEHPRRSRPVRVYRRNRHNRGWSRVARKSPVQVASDGMARRFTTEFQGEAEVTLQEFHVAWASYSGIVGKPSP